MKTCDHSNCRQGRDCEASLMATRRVLGLHQCDGGHRISGDDSPRLDAPPITASGAADAAMRAVWWIAGAAATLAIWSLVWALVRAFSTR